MASNDATLAPASAPPSGGGITEDEAALYDRQLRLWGVEAQNRMRQAHVLLCGSFRGISTEVAKNIVLAGVGRVALLDSGKVEAKDLGSGYWEREEDIGSNRVEVVAPRLQLLNPRVQITTHTDENLLNDQAFLNGFGLIVVTDRDAKTIMELNSKTRKLGKKFFAAHSVGIHGWIFADLLQHDFIIDQQKSAAPGEPTTVVPLKLSHSYCSFEDALSKHDFSGPGQKKLRKKTLKKREVLWAVLATLKLEVEQSGEGGRGLITVESLRTKADQVLPQMGVPSSDLTTPVIERFVAMQGHEFAPSCAVVGGVLGQDVLNAVGGKEEPVRNFMVFDGDLGEGGVWALAC